MSCDIRHAAAAVRTHVAVVFLALSGLALAACDEAWSQTPPAAPPVEPSPTAPPRENPGLINEIGKLLERRQPLFPVVTPPQAPSQASPEPAPAASDQAGPGGEPTPRGKPADSGLPHLDLKIPSMQKGREKCPVTADGASDCKAAADALCRAHGYREGKSTDTDATQKCSAEALLLSGRKSQPGACRTDYFVTRAWCQ